MTALLDERLKAFLRSPIMIVLATRDSTLKPTIARGAGVRVVGDHLFDLFISQSHWPLAIDHLLAKDAPVAVTCASPATYETYQIKGHAVDVTPPDDDDRRFATDATNAAISSITNLGMSRSQIDQFISLEGLIRIRISAETVFLQTPGQSAGQRRSEPA